MRWRAYLGLAHLAGARRRLPAPAGAVALTFDDGPDPDTTPELLDLLAAHGAKATFFCVGYRAAQHPELVRRILAEGHAVGSHSQTHRVGDLPTAEVLADYLTGQRALETAVGGPVTLFRPPHGTLTPAAAWRLRRSGLRTWLWTVDPTDYQPGTRTAEVADAVGNCVPGDVVLLHDALEEAPPGAPPRSMMLAALPEALATLRARGLQSVSLS